MGNPTNAFTPAELRKLRSLKDPYGIQRLLDDMPYHLAEHRLVAAPGTAGKHLPLLRGRAVRRSGVARKWLSPANPRPRSRPRHRPCHRHLPHQRPLGCVAKSNYTGCRYREPVYRSLRELALSYFDVYFNLRGERTLRTFSRPVNMARFDPRGWMTTEDDLWYVAEYLFTIHHYRLLHAGHDQEAASPRRPFVSGGVSGTSREAEGLAAEIPGNSVELCRVL